MVWCGKVPVICKWNYRTLKAAYARGHKTGKIDDDITCAIQTWWCLEHAAAMACLGGPGNPLWSCVGGYHPPVTTDIVKDLRRVANVALSCKGYAIYGAFAGAIGGLKGIAIGALNGEAGCMFNAWMENQSK
jgi:hypothetical protein